jgi:hypothetical protein
MQATTIRASFTGRRPQLQPNFIGSYLDSGDVFVFCIGLGCLFYIQVVGQLPYAEVLTALALPFIVLKSWSVLQRPGTRTVIVLMAIWIFSQTISDIVNGSPMGARLKGIARVLFLGINFIVFSAVVGRNTKRIVLLTLGLAASQFVRLQMMGVLGTATAWKFGESSAVSLIVMLLGSYLCSKRRYGLFVICGAALALANLHYGYRSQIAVDLVSVSVTLPIFADRRQSLLAVRTGFSGRIRGQSAWNGTFRSAPANRNRMLRVVAVVLLSLGAVWLAQKLVSEGVKHGLFEEGVQQKFEAQSSGKLGVLVGGRPEIPVAIRAIADAPFLGHGSYAIDPKYMVLLAEYQYEYGYSDDNRAPDLEDAGIPTHSHLTASWVEGGVLASLLWFYVLYLIVRAALRIADENPPLAPLYTFMFLTFFWDILFSPFGYDRRIFEALFMVLLVNLISDPAQQAAMIVGNRIVASRRAIVRAKPNPLRRPALPRPSAEL